MIKTSLFMRATLIGAIALAFGACTAHSGLTYDIRAVSVPGKPDHLFRVDCDGILGSAEACARAAEKFCQDQGFTALEMIDRVVGDAPKNDPREITFMCGKPQPVAQLAPASRPTPQSQVLLQGDAHFDTDSSQLTPQGRAALDSFIKTNRGTQFRRVMLTGFTDSTGGASHNLALSNARAHTVANYLRANGLSAQSFVSDGRGASDPVASNASVDGRAQNRRVEIHIDTK
ncbi:hypothetical protein WT21_04995 [Burkholderia territorii]|uniref:OmpA family protein n=1 Tax=Burkholderia territorii TaxID=1503055 RepID=UPI000754A3AA|nr:OmpA family protein [Burkholderia territorii]KVQ53642.1 hypothetical protein WT21_04995 [Burkholderia territorii]